MSDENQVEVADPLVETEADLPVETEVVEAEATIEDLPATRDPIDVALEGEPEYKEQRIPEKLHPNRFTYRKSHVKKALDATVIEKLSQALAAGNYPDAACVYAGISKNTYYSIFRNAERRPNSQWAVAARKLEYAIAQAEVRVVAQWQQHMPKSWQACAAFLAARYSERWAPPGRSGGGDRPSVNISVNQAMQTVSHMQSSGVLSTVEGRKALLELVENMSPEQETELLGEYKRLQEAAGLLTEGNGEKDG